MLKPSARLEALIKLRQAGRIAAAARRAGAARIVPGARLRDVCAFVEQEILRQGGGLAFPAQTAVNHVAAHYCPGLEEETCYRKGDLAKLDLGAHVDGHVVDTAVTVEVGGPDGRHALIQAARAALEAGIRAAHPGGPVSDVSRAIQETIESFGVQPMRNLCGHGVGRWSVHRPPAIPNIADKVSERLPLEAPVAIEPFTTEGRGWITETGRPEVFRVDPRHARHVKGQPEVAAALRAFRGLPFSRRQLLAFPHSTIEAAFTDLRRQDALHSYAPLVEPAGQLVAQAEHTIYLGEAGVEILTL